MCIHLYALKAEYLMTGHWGQETLKMFDSNFYSKEPNVGALYAYILICLTQFQTGYAYRKYPV